MATLSARHPKKSGAPWLLIGLVGAVVALSGLGFYSQKQKHDAALAHCGADTYQAWRTQFTGAVQEFDRAASAALLSPRMTLAPLVLRMSEAKAKAEALTPIPCAADGARLVTQAMALRIDAFSQFATGQQDLETAKTLQKSQADANAGVGMIEAAATKVVR